MSALAVILIVLAVLLALFIAGGALGARKRDRAVAPHYAEHLASADRALEQARASDRGWDSRLLLDAARDALATSHPGVRFPELRLVLVEDRPGIDEDVAHFEAGGQGAGAGEGSTVRVVLTRSRAGWRGETVS